MVSSRSALERDSVSGNRCEEGAGNEDDMAVAMGTLVKPLVKEEVVQGEVVAG